MRVNMVHLSSLEAIARLGTVSAAADELGYTPGALSQHMDALGRTVGRPVLAKAGRFVELTDVGRIVLSEGRAMLAAERRLMDAAVDVGDDIRDEIVLGTWGSTAAGLLAPVIDLVRATHPGLTIRCREVDLDEVGDAVARRRVDVSFGLTYGDAPVEQPADVVPTSLRSEQFRIAVRQDDERAGLMMRLVDFAESPWVLPPQHTVYGQAVRAACRKRGFEPVEAHELTDTAATLTLASKGLGVAPLTDLMLALSPESGVGVVRLEDDVNRDLVLYSATSHQERKGVLAIIEAVRTVVTSL
jgi:DNA-binding transcriptional LysR family regulator